MVGLQYIALQGFTKFEEVFGMGKVSLSTKGVCITPVWVIGTYDKAGKPNASTAAWVGMCCSSPQAVAVSFRKATLAYENILERKAFTVSIPSEEHCRETDYFGLVSGRNVDKFAATGLTPVKSGLVDAPYVQEFPFIIECNLLQHVELGLHTQFIGEIIDVKVESTILGEDGVPAIDRIRPFFYVPGSGFYYGVGRQIGKAHSIGKTIG
jgi:flavin reductase (DIM6/NTAB) family NADH-FMN oxidoreductase RutF